MCVIAVLEHVRVGCFEVGAEEKSFFEIGLNVIPIGLRGELVITSVLGPGAETDGHFGGLGKGEELACCGEDIGLERTGHAVAEELEEACGEAGCANGINDGLGDGAGGILDVGSYVNRRYVKRRGLWFRKYARHVVLLSFIVLCDKFYGVKKIWAVWSLNV